MGHIERQTILVTGGAGFVGSHLADAVADQNDVIVADDLSAGQRGNVPDAATFRSVDISQSGVLAELTKNVDIVFHQAAVVSVERSINRPMACHDVNTDATLSLLDLARERDFRVVLASSAAIYGHPDSLPIYETDSKAPLSPYGVDKLTIDHYARLYYELYGVETRLYYELYGVETVALRYFNIFGPRQRAGDYGGVISVFRRQALADDPITIDGDGTQTRDFIHIDDVVSANLRAAKTDHLGEAYNIGRGKQTSIQTLAELTRDAMDSDSDIVYTEPRPGDIDRSVADISKARRDLDFDPSVSLKTGLRTFSS
jgi:UDP-glucose 4-epimerase